MGVPRSTQRQDESFRGFFLPTGNFKCLWTSREDHHPFLNQMPHHDHDPFYRGTPHPQALKFHTCLYLSRSEPCFAA